MRLSSTVPFSPSPRFVVLLIGFLSVFTPAAGNAQTAFGNTIKVQQQQVPLTITRARLHDSDQWRDIERHLPDPNTAAPKIL